MKKRVLSLSAAALAVFTGFAEEVDHSENIELESARTFEIASGDIHKYSGIISGTGALEKSGKGKLILSGMNTFSGGVILQEGFLEVAEEGALGTGTLTLKNPNSTPAISSKFSKKDAVVTNNIKLPNTSSNASNSDPHIHVLENTTFTGNITSYANTFYMGNKDCGKNGINNAYPTNTIAGSLWIYGSRNLTLGSYGVTVLKGPVTAGGITIGTYFSSEGSLVLDTDSCNVGAFNLSSGSLYCKRQNVLNGAQLRIRQKNASSASHIDLGGFDQTCSIFGEYSSGSTFPASGTGYSINSPEGPATLTVTGAAANESCTCHFAISDRITLLLDAEPTFTCNFTTRASGTCGDIVVSNGIFSVVGTATFKAVPRIVVAEEGKFMLSSTEAEALAGVTELEVAGEFRSTASAPFTSGAVHLVIAEGAVFDLGRTLNAASLVIRGADLDAGIYTHKEFGEIAEGTTIVVPAQKRTAAWVGGGGDELVATAGNWSGAAVPDLTGGGLTAVFAESGSRAIIDRMLNLDGIVFSGVNSFSLERNNENSGIITLFDAGLSFAAASGDPERTFSFDVPAVANEELRWTVPSNTTFELRGGFTASKNVAKGGNGNLVFSGTNSFAGALVISNGVTMFSGTITTPSGVDGSGYTSGNSIRCYGATVLTNKSALTGRVYLDNAVIEKPFYTLGPSASSKSELYLWTTANSSNVIRGVWRSGTESWQRFNQPESAITVFEGGVENSTRTHFAGGTVHIRNKPHRSTGNIMQFVGGTRVIYEAAGGCVDNLMLGDATIEFRTSYSLDGGMVTNVSSAGYINLNSTTQRFARVCFGNAPNVVVDGGCGAALEVSGSGQSVIAAQLTNGVSVVNSGSGTLTLAGNALCSTGGIFAANGTVRIASGARWKNLDRLDASGSARVVIVREAGELGLQAFGRRTSVGLSGGAVLEIPAGSVQVVKHLYINGARMPQGDYSYANITDVNVKKHFADTAGVLRCIGDAGIMIIVR